ncbi:MAG TPA: LapA family protein [Methylophilaceae bacterium]|nr:LapA family protein [Methylophilaceae bacterium]
MPIRYILLIVVLSFLVIFAAINWAAIMQPTPISLIFTTIQAPLGLILLTATALLAVFFLGFMVYLQSTMLMERQRVTRELEAQRELANQAEASRFSELRSYLENELEQLLARNRELQQHIDARLVHLEQALNISIEQSGNSLSAYIGELEDRLETNSGKPRG